MDKQVEYTIKVVTNGTVDTREIVDAIIAQVPGATATCTNFRVLPKPKAQPVTK